MPRVAEDKLQELRMRYHAAHAAHQGCARAVTEATLSGSPVSPALLEQESRALRELTKVRANLMAAMAEAGSDERPQDSGDSPR